MRTPAVGATAHTADRSANNTDEPSSIRRRPVPSLTGPQTSCPAARPTMNAVMVSCAALEPACRDRATAGSAAM